MSAIPRTDFLQEACQEEDWMVQLRRELHQWPELMYQEHNTSLFLRKTLDDLNIPYKYVYMWCAGTKTAILLVMFVGSCFTGFQLPRQALWQRLAKAILW